jgi:hypothetical protein
MFAIAAVSVTSRMSWRIDAGGDQLADHRQEF